MGKFMQRLQRKFFSRNSSIVAKQLLGKLFVHEMKNGALIGKIVETEAYFGPTDQASHAHGKKTKRNFVMWGEPGHAYVYFTYGNHWLLNVVTEKIGKPGAVLIRALEPIEPKDMRTNGPGLMTKTFKISKRHNGIDLTNSELYFKDSDEKPKIINTTRIGLVKSRGDDLKLRFYIKDNLFVCN